MTKERSVFGQFFFNSPSRAAREEKVLRYVIPHKRGRGPPGGARGALRAPQLLAGRDRRDPEHPRARPRLQGTLGADVPLGGAGSQAAPNPKRVVVEQGASHDRARSDRTGDNTAGRVAVLAPVRHGVRTL